MSANSKQYGGVELTPDTSFSIPLSRGYTAYVDEDIYYQLCKYKWSAVTPGNVIYACRYNKDKYVYMHRVILEAPSESLVDHINGNTLDNRRCNLRLATKSQNAHNSLCPKGISKYKGVWYKHNRPKPWIAETRVDGVKICIGAFRTENEAGQAYNECVFKLLGNFARLNVIR